MLRLIPKMVVNSLTGSPCWYNRRSRFCCAASSFIGFVAARPRAIRASRGCGAALLAQFEFQLGDGGRDAGDGAPGRSAGVHAFPQGPHVDATAGQLMESRRDFADGASEPVYGDDHEALRLHRHRRFASSSA